MAAQKGTRDWSMQMDAGRRDTESRGRRIVLLFVVPVATLLVWQIAVWLELSPPYLLPSPEKVFLLTLPKELADGRIFLHAADSIKRVLLGVVLATATGVPLGIVIGYWRSTRDWTSTLINAGRVLPPASLIPIAVVWFGIGDAPAVFLIWFTCVWPILLNTASGVQNVEKILRDGALTLGANARDIVTTVLFPSAIPQIAAGVRIAFGLGWSVVVTSELLAVRNGLGFYIWDARLTFSMEKVFFGIVVIGIIGVLLDTLLREAQRRLFPWERRATVNT